MPKVKINRTRCKGCQLCIIYCPRKNIKVDDKCNDSGIYPAAAVVAEDCTGCGLCVLMCPDVCIEIEEVG